MPAFIPYILEKDEGILTTELSSADLYVFIPGMFFSKSAKSHFLDFDQCLGEKK